MQEGLQSLGDLMASIVKGLVSGVLVLDKAIDARPSNGCNEVDAVTGVVTET